LARSTRPFASGSAGRHWITRIPNVPRKAFIASVNCGRPARHCPTADFESFRGTLGIRIVQCRPADPEAKGLVERANGYLETSFLPGRRFASPEDFNRQLEQWLPRANHRQHRALGCRPAERLEADRAGMLSLPPVVPAVGWAKSVRLPRDHYVRLDSNDYSVHPSAVGRLVEVRADLRTVAVTLDGKPVGRHERCWARHQSITDMEHCRAAAVMRAGLSRQHQQSRSDGQQVEQRPLADYDTAFGLNPDPAETAAVA